MDQGKAAGPPWTRANPADDDAYYSFVPPVLASGKHSPQRSGFGLTVCLLAPASGNGE